jgi:hypothetical protein
MRFGSGHEKTQIRQPVRNGSFNNSIMDDSCNDDKKVNAKTRMDPSLACDI